MTRGSLTVIVPTCNRPVHLERCLRALAGQSDAIRQVIVANDGAEDVSPIVKPFGESLPVTLLRCGRTGPTAARNAALAVADGDTAAFLDDDSAPHPGWARACLRLFAEFPDVVAQLGRIFWAGALPRVGRKFLPRYRQKIYDSRHRLYTDAEFRRGLQHALGRPLPDGLPGVATHLSGGNAAIRMDFIRQHGDFDRRFRTLSDREMSWRILHSGGLIAYNPEMAVDHDHDPSLWRSLRRCFHAVPYEKLLAATYPRPPCEDLLNACGNAALTPLLDLTLAERLYAAFFRIVRWAAHRRASVPAADPLAGRSRPG